MTLVLRRDPKTPAILDPPFSIFFLSNYQNQNTKISKSVNITARKLINMPRDEWQQIGQQPTDSTKIPSATKRTSKQV